MKYIYYLLLRCPLLHFPPLQTPSTFRVFHSCDFHPCNLLPCFPLLRFQSPRFHIDQECAENIFRTAFDVDAELLTPASFGRF